MCIRFNETDVTTIYHGTDSIVSVFNTKLL